VPILLSHGIIHQVFAVHNEEELKYLVKNWVQAVFRSQPIDKVCSYFGVKLAMYFAYLGHYTRALVIPTVFGAAIYYLTETNQVSRMGDEVRGCWGEIGVDVAVNQTTSYCRKLKEI
jgi:anoctamin-8